MASQIPYEDLQAALRSPQAPLVIDVRRKAAYLAATEVLPGSLRRDPEGVGLWAEQLPRSSRVVVYCAHGREVSQRVAAELIERGLDARYLEGGIEAGWKARGGGLD